MSEPLFIRSERWGSVPDPLPPHPTPCTPTPQTGIGAGALGIAAGTLLSPLLLSAGMNPIVTVATTGMMVLFTSSATTVQYLMLGRLQVNRPRTPNPEP
jgi:uncharacterized membrane protein YfcA